MDERNKLPLFNRIVCSINKKFCNNRLKVNKLIFFKKGDLHKSFPNKKGWYFRDERKILIKEDLPIKMQLIVLAHELTHAYQHQILKYKKRLAHDQIGGETYQKFLSEIGKIKLSTKLTTKFKY